MTKNQVIEYLVTKIEDDQEPLFLLRGRDTLAVYTISRWIELARDNGVNQGKIDSAEKVFLEFLHYFPIRLPD